ncbi:MAG: hypothetical protein R8M45_06335 [Ghiorsea sp.]
MKYSEIKQLKKDLHAMDCEEWREAINDCRGTNEVELQGGDFRLILAADIDDIMKSELGGDGGDILGYFNASFLQDVTGIDYSVFEAMQKVDAQEAIGKLVISMDKLADLQKQYVSADGYGHHFAHYDGEEHELTINGANWYAFRTN